MLVSDVNAAFRGQDKSILVVSVLAGTCFALFLGLELLVHQIVAFTPVTVDHIAIVHCNSLVFRGFWVETFDCFTGVWSGWFTEIG